MNAQAKLLLYIGMICLILYFVQDRFDLFDIQFISDNQQEEVVEDEQETEETFSIQDGKLTISREGEVSLNVDVEIVDTEEERAQGLMYREELGTYSGMLFVFEEEGNNAFWMKNTKIPLDIVFIDSKKSIVDIIENAQPCLEGHICPALRPQIDYIYVLEVNGGFVEENRVEEGDTVEWVVSE